MVKQKLIFADEDRRLSDKTGGIIASMRQEAGLLQKHLAFYMGISKSYLCDLELGKRIWRVSMWNKAVKAINEHVKNNGK